MGMLLLAENVFQSMDSSLSCIGLAFVALFVLVLLIGLSMELKLGRLRRIGLAILEELRKANVQRPTPNVQHPTEERKKPPPPHAPSSTREPEPRVYKLD